MKTTQCDRILRYLNDYGSITPAEALRYFGCERLAARIYDLKKRGYVFNKKREVGRNRFGEPAPYTRYSIANEPTQSA